MTAEQQLERSVLEGKERDELHAIAQALSVKTNSRTKKADMIDGILKATGVSIGRRPARIGERSQRRRRRRLEQRRRHGRTVGESAAEHDESCRILGVGQWPDRDIGG